VLRIFGPNKDKVTRKWRKQNNCSGDEIENEISGACSGCGGEERPIQGFGGET
jgi:hypothetical protein